MGGVCSVHHGQNQVDRAIVQDCLGRPYLIAYNEIQMLLDAVDNSRITSKFDDDSDGERETEEEEYPIATNDDVMRDFTWAISLFYNSSSTPLAEEEPQPVVPRFLAADIYSTPSININQESSEYLPSEEESEPVHRPHMPKNSKTRTTEQERGDQEVNARKEGGYLVETWADQSTPDCMIADLNQYVLFHKDREGCQKEKGGGVAIAVKKDLQALRTTSLEVDGLEVMWIKLICLRLNVLIGVIYAPSYDIDVFTKLRSSIEHIPPFLRRNLIIVGDFNCPKIQWEGDSNEKSERYRDPISLKKEFKLWQKDKFVAAAKSAFQLMSVEAQCLHRPSLSKRAIDSLRRCGSAYKQWKRTKDQVDFLRWKELEASNRRIIQSEKHRRLHNIATLSRRNPRAVWKHIKKNTSNAPISPIPVPGEEEIVHPQEKAEFISKGFAHFCIACSQHCPPPANSRDEPICIQSPKARHCPPLRITTPLILEQPRRLDSPKHPAASSSPIAYSRSLGLSSKQYPTAWKQANVVPVPKKGCSREEVDAVFLDCSKAFDQLPHSTIVASLSSQGVEGELKDLLSENAEQLMKIVQPSPNLRTRSHDKAMMLSPVSMAPSSRALLESTVGSFAYIAEALLKDPLFCPSFVDLNNLFQKPCR
ncbi:hypothetical protein RvY_02371 [Ramazzottius varieornatus]|uniref:Endonuclease/exonuclease/phosphatase domain-containing protein n=1 Tax=Ramazzottius varieornatus TaxID=947166 RepID=A0A1D1UQD4_RAMVA|nr:hypothetical protein RvY_02371 [Ramazzottius varieornatus]